jgi:hypothetical protein
LIGVEDIRLAVTPGARVFVEAKGITPMYSITNSKSEYKVMARETRINIGGPEWKPWIDGPGSIYIVFYQPSGSDRVPTESSFLEGLVQSLQRPTSEQIIARRVWPLRRRGPPRRQPRHLHKHSRIRRTARRDVQLYKNPTEFLAELNRLLATDTPLGPYNGYPYRDLLRSAVKGGL